VQQRFAAIGFPAEFGTAYAALLAQTLDTPARVTDEIDRILQRPARTFADWVHEHRAVFARTTEHSHV